VHPVLVCFAVWGAEVDEQAETLVVEARGGGGWTGAMWGVSTVSAVPLQAALAVFAMKSTMSQTSLNNTIGLAWLSQVFQGEPTITSKRL
jgi:hypothetical protein